MNLTNKVVLITGGARIGKTVAEQLARKGAHIALSYNNSRGAALETAQNVRSVGRESLVIQANATRSTDLKNAVSAVVKKFGSLDVLINMASVYFPTPFKNLNEKIWDDVVDANLKSAYLASIAAAPALQKKGGRIINISDWLSASGRPRYKNFIPYYTAKTGILGLTQSLALELAPKVLVNAIAPGPIVPPKGSSKKDLADVVKATPLGRWGGAEEIAKAVVFLCETDFVTGECIRVDGGRHLN